jgi:hypothetical protein
VPLGPSPARDPSPSPSCAPSTFRRFRGVVVHVSPVCKTTIGNPFRNTGWERQVSATPHIQLLFLVHVGYRQQGCTPIRQSHRLATTLRPPQPLPNRRSHHRLCAPIHLHVQQRLALCCSWFSIVPSSRQATAGLRMLPCGARHSKIAKRQGSLHVSDPRSPCHALRALCNFTAYMCMCGLA